MHPSPIYCTPPYPVLSLPVPGIMGISTDQARHEYYCIVQRWKHLSQTLMVVGHHRKADRSVTHLISTGSLVTNPEGNNLIHFPPDPFKLTTAVFHLYICSRITPAVGSPAVQRLPRACTLFLDGTLLHPQSHPTSRSTH